MPPFRVLVALPLVLALSLSACEKVREVLSDAPVSTGGAASVRDDVSAPDVV